MIGAVILTSPPWKAILPFINNFELSSGCLVSHFCRCFFNSLRNRNVTKAAEQLNSNDLATWHREMALLSGVKYLGMGS
jgi:hypothetical protein